MPKLFDSTGRIAIIALTLAQIKNSIRTIEVLADQACDTAAEKKELIAAFSKEVSKITSSSTNAATAAAVDATASATATEPAATEPAVTEPTPQ